MSTWPTITATEEGYALKCEAHGVDSLYGSPEAADFWKREHEAEVSHWIVDDEYRGF